MNDDLVRSIAFYFFVLGCAYFIATRRKKHRTRKASALKPFDDFSCYYEWIGDKERVSVWKQLHPLGPTTEDEAHELEELIFAEIGSYQLLLHVRGQPIWDDYCNQLLDDIRGWRH